MSVDLPFVAVAAEAALFIGGLMLLWRLGLSPSARRAPAVLPAWEVTGIEFFIFLWFVASGGALGPLLAGLWIKSHVSDYDFSVILATLAQQLGLLAGVLLYHLTYGRRHRAAPVEPRINLLTSGAATYLITVPVVLVIGLVWQGLLNLAHVPTPRQESIDILTNLRDPFQRGLLLTCAIVFAPIVEELVFRAGLFRYLRTRSPRWVALLLPAVLFAALHQNLASFPALVALGVIFALAYERTGRIGTSIVAHAFFNLSTTLLILAGLDT